MDSLLSRRRFLQASAAIAGGLALPAYGADADPLPVIDAHTHLWDLEAINIGWPRGELRRNMLAPEYQAAFKGLNVVKSVYAEVAVGGGIDSKLQEAEWINGLCKGGFPAAATVGGNPADPGFKDYISRYKGSLYIKGARQIVDRALAGEAHPFRASDFIQGVRLLGELDMEFDMCTHPMALDEAVRLLAACPDMRFVLTHCANPDTKAFSPATSAQARHDADAWRRGIDAVAKAGGDRIVCKISHFIVGVAGSAWTAADLAPIVDHVLDAFGPDRCVWGSDWPVCLSAATPSQWLGAFKEVIAKRPLEEQRKVLHDNAARFYKLT